MERINIMTIEMRGLIEVTREWSSFKKILDGTEKRLALQFEENNDDYSLFAIDGSIVYTTIIYKEGFEPVGWTDAQKTDNTNDRDDFIANWTTDANNIATSPAISPAQAGSLETFGLTASRRSGYVTLSGTSTQPLRATDYVAPEENSQRSIVSSSGQDVSPDGVGAREVKIIYYDADLTGPWEEIILLDGANPINTVATNIAFVERIEVIEVGSDGSNAGTIELYTDPGAGGSVIGSIAPGDNITYWAHHYVGTDNTSFITEIRVGADVLDGEALFSKRNPIDPTSPQITIETIRFETRSEFYSFTVPEKIKGPAIVFLNVKPSDIATVNIYGSLAFYESKTRSESFMSVQTVSHPVPPNSNLSRSLFVWTANDGSTNDVLDTDTKIQALLDHCATHGINLLYFDIYSYLGKNNWTGSRVQRVQLLLERCHESAIDVMALAGNVDWGQNHKWVMDNILLPMKRYQSLSTEQQRFDGFIFDVEYWTDESSYPPADHLPGLLDLVRKFRDHLYVPVGVFSAFGMMGGDGGVATRTNISYRGKSAQDGEHMMDHCDFVVIGCYWHSADGQNDRFISWYNYAKDAADSGRNVGLYCGSETLDDVSDTQSYWQEGRVFMEGEHTTLSDTFYVVENSVFMGHAIHDYEHHSTMSD